MKNILKVIIETLNTWITLVEKEKKQNKEDLEKEEDEEKKTIINKRRDPEDNFRKLNKFLHDFVHFKSFFFDYLHIYATSFASMTGSPN